MLTIDTLHDFALLAALKRAVRTGDDRELQEVVRTMESDLCFRQATFLGFQ